MKEEQQPNDRVVTAASSIEVQGLATRVMLRPRSIAALAKAHGLRLVTPEALTISRRRRGRGFVYCGPEGKPLRDRATIRRLASLAVPPAYHDVFCSPDPTAHLQAIGRDDAGRLQYRYHPDWENIREARKARRLARFVHVLPKIRRNIGRCLASSEATTRDFALAAVIELVARSSIRSGSEAYARLNGTRGAATLLKSNVSVAGEVVTLAFRAKGGKNVRKEFRAARLALAIEKLMQLPGRRLFQYRDEAGAVRPVTARPVNAFLREIAGGIQISLKDFRTLLASAAVLETLARQVPGTSERQRRRQVLEAVRTAAGDLANTPAICRRSYVHATVVTAFEDGVLEHFADLFKSRRSATLREQILAKVIAMAAA